MTTRPSRRPANGTAVATSALPGALPEGASPPTLTVGHGPRTDLMVVATLPTGGIALLLALGWVFLPKLRAMAGIADLALVVLVFALVSTWVWATSGTEQVVLSSEGIRVRKRAFGSPMVVDAGPLVRWEWLDPVIRGPVGLGFAHFRWHRPGGYLEWFHLPVTPSQAAAIRAYPSCPVAYRAPEAGRR